MLDQLIVEARRRFDARPLPEGTYLRGESLLHFPRVPDRPDWAVYQFQYKSEEGYFVGEAILREGMDDFAVVSTNEYADEFKALSEYAKRNRELIN